MNPSLRLAVAVMCLAAAPARAGEDPVAAIAGAIGPEAARRALAGVVARAACRGPRGEFTTEVVSLGGGIARFRQVRATGTTELLLSGGTAYARGGPGAPFGSGGAELASFVAGHEVHRMLLDLDHRFRVDGAVAADGCVPLRGPDGLAATVCAPTGGHLPARLELELPVGAGGGTVAIELGEWRAMHGVRLPYAATFRHAGEVHAYVFTAVLPFRLAVGSVLPEAPAPLFARLGDLADLAAAHERTLAAHRASDVDLLLADAAAVATEGRRGELVETAREDVRKRLGDYLAAIRFTRYEDVVPPAVAVATDGSLGWLACEVEAEGERRVPGAAPEAIAYGFTWVELYARTGDRWLGIGNFSSPRP